LAGHDRGVNDPRREATAPIAARDAALARLWRLRRWLVVTSFAGAGIVAAVAAQAKPGKSTGSTASGSAGQGHVATSQSRLPTGSIHSWGGASASQLAPPPAAPAPAPSTPAPVTSSGGS